MSDQIKTEIFLFYEFMLSFIAMIRTKHTLTTDHENLRVLHSYYYKLTVKIDCTIL